MKAPQGEAGWAVPPALPGHACRESKPVRRPANRVGIWVWEQNIK